MDLFVLVHHQKDLKQPWKNNWLDANLSDPSELEYIYTKHSLAMACEAERLAGKRVFIHRCSYKSSPRVICASVDIATVDLVQNKVVFVNHVVTSETPPIQANQGQISYVV